MTRGMNRAAELIDYLSRASDCDVLVVAPMAPPVDRNAQGLRVALTKVFDAADVGDTLTNLRSRAAGGDNPATDPSGTFSFGLKDVGRFRVSYMTQRGSKVVSITRVPMALSRIETLCDSADRIEKVVSILRHPGGGGLAISGPNTVKNSAFAYALLQRINKAERRIIYCLERSLTFLMHHDNSIVIQSELGVDVPSIELGIRSGLQFSPDIMFVGDVRTAAEMASIAQAMQAGVFTVFAAAAATAESLLHLFSRAKGGLFARVAPMLKGVVHVTPLAQGKVAIEFSEKLES